MRAAFSMPETGDSKRRSLDIDHHNNRTIIYESKKYCCKKVDFFAHRIYNINSR